MPAKKARTKKMALVQDRSIIDRIEELERTANREEEIAIEPPTEEYDKRKFAAFVSVACAVGLIVMVGVAGILSPITPTAKTEVVTGVVEAFIVRGDQLCLKMKDQPGPHQFESGTGWILVCKTPPAFIIGEEYTFTYRENELLSCYKEE
jgi:hypothetical protein